MNTENLKPLATVLECIIRDEVRQEMKRLLVDGSFQLQGPPEPPRGALKRKEAARYLSISLTTLSILVAAGRIEKTIYGTYPVASLDEHLKREMERKPRGRRRG